jgi:ankyrin repeat protein
VDLFRAAVRTPADTKEVAMSAFRRALPARPDLEQQKTLAKELLTAFRRGDPEARARIRAELPDKSRIALADAQFVLAREYGFAAWAALKQEIASREAEAGAIEERFRRAVQTGDTSALHQLTRHRQALQGIVNAPMFAFDSPAIVATAGRGDVPLVDALLALGADPNATSRWWAGAFHALYSATDAVAERLLDAGAVPDACAAAHLDRADLLEKMLAADPSRVHERGGDGQTPLHFARSREVADLLLARGADIDARDVDHRSTPAQWMLGDAHRPDRSRLALARYLVDRGATADIFLAAALGLANRVLSLVEENPSLLSLRTSQGEYGEKPPSSYHIYQWTIGPNATPLQAAVHFGQRQVIEAVRHFAPPAQLLLLACHEARRDDALALLRLHPGLVQSLGEVDRRALCDEAWVGNAPAVELMMELRFDPTTLSANGSSGTTALHCAAWNGSVRSVAAILRHPARAQLVTARDLTYGGTPLGWCCHGSLHAGRPAADYAEVARQLIAAGARPEARMEGSAAVQAVLAAAAS